MNFRLAIADYRFLKNRGYPDKAALKLVGDRYRLEGMARNCLFRAVFAEEDCRRRTAKLVGARTLVGRELGVDWYNVLITVESYLKGFPVFIADDGLLRDSAGIHGSYKPGRVTPAAVRGVLEALSRLEAAGLAVFLDCPISFSGAMADELRGRLPALGTPFAVTVEPSADYPLKSFAGVVATSDSSIIDRESVREVLDLPRCVLEAAYGARLRRIEELELGEST